MRAPQREVEECFARLSAGAEQQEPTAANSVRCPPDRGEKASVDRSHLWAAAPDRPTGGKVWRSTVDVGAPNERRQRQRTCSLPARPGGKCERGATAPLSQEGNYESELAGARRRRARKLRLPSQERLGVGVSVRLLPHFGSAARSAGRFQDGAPTQSRTDDPSLTKLMAPFENRLVGGTRRAAPGRFGRGRNTSQAPSRTLKQNRRAPSGPLHGS